DDVLLRAEPAAETNRLALTVGCAEADLEAQWSLLPDGVDRSGDPHVARGAVPVGGDERRRASDGEERRLPSWLRVPFGDEHVGAEDVGAGQQAVVVPD